MTLADRGVADLETLEVHHVSTYATSVETVATVVVWETLEIKGEAERRISGFCVFGRERGIQSGR